eukprot:COSAG03_NODE_4204_length_1641_cov_1.439689_1_plen_25_part_10
MPLYLQPILSQASLFGVHLQIDAPM